MKLLFLNPFYGKGFCKTARWFAKSRARERRHPDYLCTAIALLEKGGHICKFIDGTVNNISIDETREICRGFGPDAVIINSTTPSIESDLEYAKMCKKEFGAGLITIMVGAHVSAEPEDTLRKGGGALDAVARREYDYTLKEFADTGNLSRLAGISYFKDDGIIHNPDRPFIDDLDNLPFPAWHHINLYDYYAPAKRNPFLTVITGRGCEGRCTFCLFPQVMYGRKYRPRSPERVLDEIESDIKLFPGLKEIMFEDDTFTLHKFHGRLEKICQGMLDRRIKVGWSCNARPDIQDFSILKLMKRSGCRMVCVGFESGNEEILANIKKGISLDAMSKFTHLCKKAGLSVHGCFVIGAQGETNLSIKKTVRFATGLPIDTVQFSGLCPYPGTEFYRWCKDKNYLIPGNWKEWVDENGEQRTIIDYPHLSCETMNKAIDSSLYSFYLRPRYILSQVFHPKSLHDIQSRLKGLLNFINHVWVTKTR
ncbi:MAG: B12-binding domain-containing radical SAM protein [Candidatus Omnitrophica bacterium]|nr:B12-binding domain-containing radical SAM protein [Candidatus Omnitrophota bacterium]